MSLRLGIDVGGTFTDVAVLDEGAGAVRFDKVSTTPAAPSEGVLHAFEKAGVALPDIGFFVHGTTLALNALLTRSGVDIALITTQGFRDVYELGRTDREVMYDLTYRKPSGFVTRDRTFEVAERMSFAGDELVPFDEAHARAVARQIAASGVSAVAVSFLHSYASPAHELAMERVLRAESPDMEITLSHRLVREYREYERTSTAVIDAYIKPVVRSYLRRLGSALDDAGCRGRFLVTRSGGGAMTAETAAEQPAHLVLSGPASGVIGATAFGEIIGETDLVTIDMGGTSLDVSLIVDGEPTTVNQDVFEGQPIALPSLKIHTIGAGGGSIAWIDDAGHLQVGPRSAGAVPGPACYDLGGEQATVTDAALLVGHLGESTALGGELVLVRGRAEEVVARLGQRIGLDAIGAADGILRIATTKVAAAVREITVDSGHDPSGFALLAYGGGGGLVAAAVARDLGMRRVVVPPGPGAFSAFGMLFTDVIHDLAQTRVSELEAVGPADLTASFGELERRGRAALEADGFVSGHTRLQRTCELRYAGQEHTVEVPVAPGVLAADDLTALVKAFGELHEGLYGHRMDDPVELVTLRLRAVGVVARPEPPTAGEGADAARIGHRDVHTADRRPPTRYDVYRRERLGRGSVVVGPAIVEEHTATTVLHADDVLRVGDHGELLIAIAGGGHPEAAGT